MPHGKVFKNMFCTMISFYNDHNDICTLTANEGPTVHCLASEVSMQKNGQLGPRLIILEISLTLLVPGGGRSAPTITYLRIRVCVCVYTC